jgi:hypothetical protein
VEGVIDFTLCLILLVKWLLNFLCYAVDDFFRCPLSFATQPLFIVAKRQCEYVYEFSTSSSSTVCKTCAINFLLLKLCFYAPKGYVIALNSEEKMVVCIEKFACKIF